MQRRDRPKNIPLISAIAQLGWSYSKTAGLAGIDKTTLSKLICQRQDATPATQEKLAKVLGVQAADIFPAEVRRD